MNFFVRDLQPEDVPACERILLALPEWSGLSASNMAFIESLRRLPAFVPVIETEVVGFLALETHTVVSAEIRIVAVKPFHRNGVGHALVSRARDWCAERSVRWLHVKTRGPSTPDPYYERTRSFFAAEGFDPLFESLTLWGSADAALVLVRSTAAALPPNSALQPTATSPRSVRGG
jgi:GNAT superfamily N-acetyltransferase